MLNDLNKPFVIAELSGNHNGSLERAKQLIKSAKENGADCVKLQTYTPDTMTIKSNKEDFLITTGLWDGYNLWDLYDWAQTPLEWQETLFNYAKELDITCISTPFDETAVDLLESLNCPFYKIASFWGGLEGLLLGGCFCTPSGQSPRRIYVNVVIVSPRPSW